MNNNLQAFFALVKAGLWGEKANLLPYGNLDYSQILKMAEEQTVVGLVAAGIESVKDSVIPKEIVLQFVGATLQIEQNNSSMNVFIEKLIGRLRKQDVYTLLVKGQGIAQCYERPLWRACGDVDLLLSDDNYKKAKDVLVPIAASLGTESGKHIGIHIESWEVELHGDQHCGLSRRMDDMIDDVQKDLFYGGNVRTWVNGKTQVFLPGENNDVMLIFTHFIKHFYKGGLGLRQLCDWCRLLYTYHEKLDLRLLESRIRKAGLMSEWMAFGAYAVEYLGMPTVAMPFYSDSGRWKRKANRINAFVLKVGNFGHNRDTSRRKEAFLIRKAMSFSRRLVDVANHALIFPLDSLRFFPTIVFNGIKSAIKGVG